MNEGASGGRSLAYSAIEELDLSVKASSENPRNIEGTPYWRPEFLDKFKERLKKAGLDPDTKIDWVALGGETEIPIYQMMGALSHHSDGVDIRDRQVPLPDAINFCEYLRNKMTAHAFSSQTKRLGPYEVYNVQQVARFLILSKCNLWNTWTEDLRMRYNSALR